KLSRTKTELALCGLNAHLGSRSHIPQGNDYAVGDHRSLLLGLEGAPLTRRNLPAGGVPGALFNLVVFIEAPPLDSRNRARRDRERAVPLCAFSVSHPEQNAKGALFFGRRGAGGKGVDIGVQISS